MNEGKQGPKCLVRVENQNNVRCVEDIEPVVRYFEPPESVVGDSDAYEAGIKVWKWAQKTHQRPGYHIAVYILKMEAIPVEFREVWY